MLLRVLTAMRLPSKSLPVLYGAPFFAIRPAKSGGASPVLLPLAMISTPRPWRAARIVEITLLNATCTWPAASAGMPAAPPWIGVVSTSSPSAAKKPLATATCSGATSMIGMMLTRSLVVCARSRGAARPSAVVASAATAVRRLGIGAVMSVRPCGFGWGAAEP